jgi:hypothetical protein
MAAPIVGEKIMGALIDQALGHPQALEHRSRAGSRLPCSRRRGR